MKRLLALLCLTTGALNAQAVDIGVSISVAQPGVYGRIDIGRFPQPVLMQSTPVIIQRGPHQGEPVYLWVPPGHQKNWRKHCHSYQACGVPVYFVKEDWYQDHVMGKGRGKGADKHPDKGHGKGHDKGHGKGRDRDRD